MISEQNNNRDKYFKGQQNAENLVCFLRHHWIYLIKELIYLFIFAFIIFISVINIDIIQDVLRGNRELKLLFLTGYIAITYFLHRIFIKILNFFVNIGIVTDFRFIDHQKSLFFRDSMDNIDLLNIQNIEMVGDGILRNLLGYGDLKIYLSSSTTLKVYYCLSNIKFHFRCISRLKEARHKMFAERGQVNLTEIGGTENARIFHITPPEKTALESSKTIPFEEKYTSK